MNTLVNYLLAFTFQVSAILMPHNNDSLIVSKPCTDEEITENSTISLPLLNEQKLEDNCLILFI